MRLLFLLLFPCFLNAQSITITAGGTAGSIPSSYAVFNVKAYGAVGDNSTNNTTYIQAAINAAHIQGGIVYFPAGTYKTNKLTTYTNVTIKGDGYLTSFIKSISADTMFVLHNLAPALAGVQYNDLSQSLIEDIYLNGDSIGTVGFYANRAANFKIGRCYFNKFRNKGLMLVNCLIGNVDNCYFYYNPIGVYGYSDYSQNTATTHVTLRDCVVNFCRTWAVSWTGGGMLNLDKCDFEVNGTVYDTLTGAVNYYSNIWPGGLIMNGCWMEENHGTVVNIVGNTAGANFAPITVHSIINCQDLGQFYSFTKRNIYLSGNNQRLTILNSVLSKAETNIISSGTSNKINLLSTYYSTSTQRNGATLTVIDQ
jgi:hypothetical protein